MRSKLSTFVTVAVVAMLCTVVFAGAAFKAPDQSQLFQTKYGLPSAPQESRGPVAKLPPVGPRNGNPLDEVIISENFESYSNGQLPTGWTQVDVDGGYCAQFARNSTWQVYNYGTNAHGGVKVAMDHYNDGALPNNDWLILPQQNLTGQILLTYWAAAQDPLYSEDYEVKVSTTGAQPANFTHLIQDFNQIDTTWQQHQLDLSAYAGAPFYVAFHYNSVDEFVLKIDDLVLETIEAGTVGTVEGTVTNSDGGAPLANCNVSLEGTTYQTITDEAGQFRMVNVEVATYDLIVSRNFFLTDTTTGVDVAADETTHVDVALTQIPGLHLFESTASPVPINDGDTSRMEITVDPDQLILDMDVLVNITHTWDGDLDIWLEGPGGNRVQLVLNDIAVSGDNFINTIFDDEATTPFTDGTPPFTGSFIPLEPLNMFDGSSCMGTWALVVYDNNSGDVGSIDNFTLVATLEGTAAHDPATVPSSFSFAGNYPNPFNATTQFSFVMAHAGHASLVLYNLAGQEVARIVDGDLSAGDHVIPYTASALPTGMYFARFNAPNFSATQKMVLLK